MSLQRSKENNSFFGKTHTEKTKTLLGQIALGRKHSEETLLKMSASKGHLVYIYEKCDSSGFKLIGSFVSMRSAAKFLGISGNTVRLYVNSGKIFKERYKFSSLAP
jgi:group I intron endonuclease